jgi:hypothetical protein
MTGCNAFVGWYAKTLAVKLGVELKHNLGIFAFAHPEFDGKKTIQPLLPGIGRMDAWVESAKGRRPKPGDILRHVILHVDVAIGFDKSDKRLIRIAAGQGSPERGYDVLRRVTGDSDYSWAKLQGWIDIDRFFGANVPVPSWLPGWWRVTWRGQTYYYYIDGSREARWTQTRPADPTQPLLGGNDTGSVWVETGTSFTITWRTTQSVEEFSLLPYEPAQVEGMWNSKEKIEAQKLWPLVSK